jgi:hypothetical protein
MPLESLPIQPGNWSSLNDYLAEIGQVSQASYRVVSDGVTVTAYDKSGAKVSSGTDVGAVMAAVFALLPASGGSVVFRNDGNVFPLTTRIALPQSITNLLYIQGNGATLQIQAGASPPTAFKFAGISDYSTLQNVWVDNLIVDRNSISDASNTIFHPGYFQRINVNGLAFTRIRVINCPSGTTNGHIQIASQHLANGETQTQLQNIYIADIRATGGVQVVQVIGPKPAGGANCEVFHDNIVVERVTWDAGATPTGTNLASAIHIGSTGFGNRAVVRDCALTGATDVAVEVDGMQDALVENVEATDPWNASTLFGNFHNPPNVDGQVCTARNVKCRIVSAANASLIAFQVAMTTAPLPFGHAILDACELEHNGNILGGGSAIVCGSNGTAGPCQRLTVRDFQIAATSITDATVGSKSINLIWIVPSTNCLVRIQGTRIKLAGSSTNGSLNLRAMLIGGKTSTTPTVNFLVEDTQIDCNITGLTGTRAAWIWIGGGSTATLGGTISGTQIINGVLGTTDTVVQVDGTGTLTINGRITISGGNHTAMPASAVDFTVDATQTALGRVVTTGNVWKTKPAPVALTGLVTATGKILGAQAATVLWPAIVTFTQGSGSAITAIDYSTNGGTTYTNYLTQASAALPAGFDQSLGPLTPDALVKVTFTTTQPTVTLVPVNP